LEANAQPVAQVRDAPHEQRGHMKRRADLVHIALGAAEFRGRSPGANPKTRMFGQSRDNPVNEPVGEQLCAL
jgi:hypothetical protein